MSKQMDVEDPVIFTVINEPYLQLGLMWGMGVRQVTGISPTFVCADDASFRCLDSHGFPCITRIPLEAYSHSETVIYKNSTYSNDAAAYVISMKMVAALSFMEKGKSVIYSDVDAMWLVDPIPRVLECDSDIAFQPGSFPANVKEAWGFTVCAGFFYMRPGNLTKALARSAIERFDGSDQRTLNELLLDAYDLAWPVRPENWEHCQIENGWLEPLHGVCRATGMRFTALPHTYFQRHGTMPETCTHAIICHPNSPKDQGEKFKILRNLDILPKNAIGEE